MKPLRVASYNIHGCIGNDGRRDPERIRRVIRALDADVIALQEVQSDSERPLLDYLVEDSEFIHIEGPTLRNDAGHYGNALLTRFELTQHRLLDLSVTHREPRGAISALLNSEHGVLRVFATHLGLSPAERRTQTRQLLNWITPPEHNEADITLLLGDLNEWFLWGRPLRWLRAHFGATPSMRSYPARWPLFALDRIWVHPGYRLIRAGRVSDDLTRVASDHLPVFAELTRP